MSEKVSAGVDLDMLERRMESPLALDSADCYALIAELRAARAVDEQILLLFTTPDKTSPLREKAMTDPAFHAALRIIQVLRERVAESDRLAGERQ